MKISKTMKMADIIHLDFSLLSVLYRFKINLGFGERTVEQVCENYNVNPNFFLEIANAYIDKEYFPSDELQHFPLSVIIDYLKATHRYYLYEKIPELQQLFDRLIETQNEKAGLFMIQRFFSEYFQEFKKHINREEDKVYPFVLMLENDFQNKKTSQSFLNELNRYGIKDYEKEHDDIEEKLFDLKNILLKYIPPMEDYHLIHHILSKLFRIEKDINDHSHIEDKVLIPKVDKLEKLFLTAVESKSIQIV